MGLKKIIIFLLTLFIFLIPVVVAHVPIIVSNGNNSILTAKHVSEPTKSWVIYSEIKNGGTADYYKLEFEKGERLYVSLLIPDMNDFFPELIIMGPRLSSEGELPEYVELPGNDSYIVVDSEMRKPEYEPFTPGSYYYLASYDTIVNQTGTYYVVVHDPVSGGKYGLAVGFKEKYGVVEWILVPFDVVKIHMWEGQPLWFIFAPMVLVVGIGLTYLFWLNKKSDCICISPVGWLFSSFGLLYLGSGTIMLTQMALAVSKSKLGVSLIVTVMFALLPMVLGYLALRTGIKIGNEIRVKDRVKLVIYGLIGLIIWAGLIVGPTIAFITSVIPPFTKNNKK